MNSSINECQEDNRKIALNSLKIRGIMMTEEMLRKFFIYTVTLEVMEEYNFHNFIIGYNIHGDSLVQLGFCISSGTYLDGSMIENAMLSLFIETCRALCF